MLILDLFLTIYGNFINIFGVHPQYLWHNVDGHKVEHQSISHHQQGRIDFNTVNPSLPTGKDFLIHSL